MDPDRFNNMSPEEKKRLKQNHERRLQGLKARQKAARERLRAQP